MEDMVRYLDEIVEPTIKDFEKTLTRTTQPDQNQFGSCGHLS